MKRLALAAALFLAACGPNTALGPHVTLDENDPPAAVKYPPAFTPPKPGRTPPWCHNRACAEPQRQENGERE